MVANDGSFNASAGGDFNNNDGNIIALGEEKSSIKAKKNINNTCLPPCERKGELHIYQSGENFFSRWSLEMHLCQKEQINQSPGANILINGETTFKGDLNNVGSTILTGKQTVEGNVNSISQLDNKAMVSASDANWESNNVQISNSPVQVYEDLSEE